MTWGSQNTESEAHMQIDYAVDNGVNFIDTAEMYPTTPLSSETQGKTEAYLGSWLKKNGRRDKVVVATKVVGKGIKWIRDGEEISPDGIKAAVESSLRRLQTDYIDLYQLHWPNRGGYHFRRLWAYDPSKQDIQRTRAHMLEVLQALQDLVVEGKIRHIGLSNETCWGTMQFLQLAEQKGLPRVASIQNEYGLMHRLFDADFAELSHYEDVGLLAYSPLAAGMLSGKYVNGALPEGSRRSLIETLHGRYSEDTDAVVQKYVAVANAHGLDAAQMALAFCLTRPFMASVIIGATTPEQLATNIASKDVALSDAVIDDINAVHRQHPLPF